jgi:Sep15/SelM redox domain
MLSFLFLSIAQAVSQTKLGRIETCSGCKLNRLHDVRKFVQEEHKKYTDLSVKFIAGHNPDLVILDEKETELERIDLTKYDLNGLHALMKAKGFQQKNNIKEEL